MTGFAGTWQLMRLALRRDRVLLPAWIAIFVGMTIVSAAGTVALYPDEASRIVAAAAINKVPTFVAMYGRVWDPTSLGELSMIKMSGLGAVFISILAALLMIRHTRADEESGRSELLAAGPIGPLAPLASAFAVTLLSLVAIGGMSAAGLAAVGLPLDGSIAFGLAWIAVGLVFAGVAAVTAQVSASARAADAFALIAIAVAYIVRAIGDLTGGADGSGVATWLSPIGWSQQARAYAGDNVAVLLVSVGATAVLVVVAVALNRTRDFGAGLLHERTGRARAQAPLASVWALAIRQQSLLVFAWLLSYAIVGALMGTIASDLHELLSTPQASQMITALGGTSSVVDGFISLEFGIFAFATAAFGISITRRTTTEEAAGRAELVLAGSVSRASYVMSQVAIALVGSTALMFVQGAAFALADAQQTGNPAHLGTDIAAALVWLPAVWTMTGLAVLLTGGLPRAFTVAWGALVLIIVAGELGALLDWPSWVLDLSPFSHIPALPGAAMDWAPVIALTAIAAALIAAGTWLFARRDLDTS